MSLPSSDSVSSFHHGAIRYTHDVASDRVTMSASQAARWAASLDQQHHRQK